MNAKDCFHTIRLVVADYINWRLHNNQNDTNSVDTMIRRIMSIVHRVGSECEQLYRTHISEVNLQIVTPSIDHHVMIDLQRIHTEIAQEMFNDNIINWNRVIMFISFSALLCERITQAYNNLPLNMIISLIVQSIINFFDINFRVWFQEQNDWVTIDCLPTDL